MYLGFFTVAVSSLASRSASGTFASLCKSDEGALAVRRGRGAETSYEISIG